MFANCENLTLDIIYEYFFPLQTKRIMMALEMALADTLYLIKLEGPEQLPALHLALEGCGYIGML